MPKNSMGEGAMEIKRTKKRYSWELVTTLREMKGGYSYLSIKEIITKDIGLQVALEIERLKLLLDRAALSRKSLVYLLEEEK